MGGERSLKKVPSGYPLAQCDTYRTDPGKERTFFSRLFLRPLFMFYPQVFWIIWKNSRNARSHKYSDEDWAMSSHDIVHALENVGVRFRITGMENMRKCPGPVVFIANHMSTLETFVLPAIIQPVKLLTFVVKDSLVSMPFFGPIMRSRNPIVVGRTNAREDLRTVLTEGEKKLRSGISIVIFPQSTRSSEFRPEDFNSLGIKLAVKAGAKVIPIALKTDAWGVGKMLKDLGPLDVNKTVHLCFGEPLEVKERGTAEHQKVIDFIMGKLREWKVDEAC